MDLFRHKLGKILDLEKLIAKTYTYSIQHKVKAVYFENVSSNRLREFKQVITTLRAVKEAATILREKRGAFRSRRLNQLLAPDSDGGLYPTDLEGSLADLESMLVWKKTPSGEDEIPEPQPGLDETFDRANNRVLRIKQKLDHLLGKIRTQFNND